MSRRARARASARILKAISSATRLRILNLLFDEGPKSYTELMNRLKLNPTRDAGKFAYHLKALLAADLVEPDSKTKKYRLTDLGRVVLDLTEEIEKYAYKRRKMHVRTSRLSLEEFDRTKIVESLIKEADVPVELAQKVARETEKRLQQFKTKYLTAPLIREIVNAVLIEKGLEEYRHKLTRLGLPVYDVTQLIQRVGEEKKPVDTIIEKAGKKVLEEYVLLNVLPRDIADAYLSGYLHLENLQTWIIKPTVTFHDLRYFLKNGIKTSSAVFPKPKSFHSALALTLVVLKKASNEATEHVLPYFNVFLAPYIENMSPSDVKEYIRTFIHELSQFPQTAISLSIEFEVPTFLAEEEAVKPGGSSSKAVYGDYFEETQVLASAILEAILEESRRSLVLNPYLTVNLRSLSGEGRYRDLLFKSHVLAAETGLPYFANMLLEHNEKAVYSASGFRLGNEWSGDWEVDILRTGSLGTVFINLPRLVYEANGNLDNFFGFLNEYLEMAFRALEIKSRWIAHCAKEGLLPLLTGTNMGGIYFRSENASRNVSFTGLNEAVMALTGKMLHEDKDTIETAVKIVKYLNEYSQRLVKKNLRAVPSMLSNFESARRFVDLDVERYGWAKVKTSMGREYPIYTDLTAVPLNIEIPLNERLRIEERFHTLCPGGHLLIIQLENSEKDTENLLSTTNRILSSNKIGFYAYNHDLSYCSSCNKVFLGFTAKCPECGSTEKLMKYSRANAKYSRVKSENIRFFEKVRYMLNSI
ncbi:helix-turn-helix domain-containing protein [Candidatus Bathyarchaeota archaeon]|nr:helix-turn-helix domain-containing protein [Candidatus Bathyarchaeota archaeon]